MAIQVKYASTSAAGAGDGSSWANRAALFASGLWGAVVTSHSATDSVIVYIGPGTYTCSQALESGIMGNAPGVKTPLILHGCDGSGNPLTPADQGWTSDQPGWDDSGLPNIQTTTNIATLNLANTSARFIKLSASGRNGPIVTNGTFFDWCSVVNSTSNSSAIAAQAALRYTNCLLQCSGNAFDTVMFAPNASIIRNCRIWGTGSSGNRRGITYNGSNQPALIDSCTVFGVGGDGITSVSTNTGQLFFVLRSVIYGCGGTAIKPNNTLSQTAAHQFVQNMVVASGAYGIDAQSRAVVVAINNRLRNNTSGNFNGLGNLPDYFWNETGSGSDSDEFVDASGKDFRIKNTSSLWGKGFGVSDQPAGGGTVAFAWAG